MIDRDSRATTGACIQTREPEMIAHQGTDVPPRRGRACPGHLDCRGTHRIHGFALVMRGQRAERLQSRWPGQARPRPGITPGALHSVITILPNASIAASAPSGTKVVELASSMTAGPRSACRRQFVAPEYPRFERARRVVAHHRAAPRNPRPRRHPRRRQPGPDGVVLAGHCHHQPQVDDFDRLIGGGVAVAAVVLGVEGSSASPRCRRQGPPGVRRESGWCAPGRGSAGRRRRRTWRARMLWPLDRISMSSNHRHPRHARACRGHPRLACGGSGRKTWMAGTSPAMTPGVPI